MKTASIVFAASVAAAASAALAADGPVEKVKVKAIAHFQFDKTAVLPADQAAILAEVAQMKDVTWQTVTTTGYTDSVGAEPYNERLSGRRAQAVKAYLVGKGLDPAMIKTAGKGEQSPIADNDSEEGRSKNRRTEIEFEGVRASK
jgi:OOP family OmpA-OmpF porin